MADVELTDPLGRTIVLHDRTCCGHIVGVHPEIPVQPQEIFALQAANWEPPRTGR
ncbi:MAG: hypothetical protein ACUVXJ_18990 [Phycisphaerae bacterium]